MITLKKNETFNIKILGSYSFVQESLVMGYWIKNFDEEDMIRELITNEHVI